MSTPFGLPDNDQSDVLFAFTDAAGNPALAPTIDPGSVIATASDPTVLAVIPNADLSGVTVSADGPLSQDVTVNVSFTVAGVLWSGSEDFAVDASGPTQLMLSPQTPVAKTPVVPVAATTTAVASPASGASASGSQVSVTSTSTGAVTYSIDTTNSTAPSPTVSSTGAVIASGPGNVVVDVAVSADAQFEASSASVTIDFTS